MFKSGTTKERILKDQGVRDGHLSPCRQEVKSRFENILPTRLAAPLLMSLLGAKKRAKKEYTAFIKKHYTWYLPDLPKAFCGLRILHLSDLHIDLCPSFAPALAKELTAIININNNGGKARADICVITGDFQDDPKKSPHSKEIQDATKKILESLNIPTYGVLGNHDSLETAEVMETLGIKMLVNQTHTLKNAGQSLFLCGIDDPHYFQTHNLNQVDGSGFRILLAHSPEIYQEALSHNFALCLCGHTHAGQIQLPFLGPIVHRAIVPEPLFHGRWQMKKLSGYTSAGVGASAVALRLNCPPEIVIHELKSKG